MKVVCVCVRAGGVRVGMGEANLTLKSGSPRERKERGGVMRALSVGR